jgi:hypothetical protein
VTQHRLCRSSQASSQASYRWEACHGRTLLTELWENLCHNTWVVGKRWAAWWDDPLGGSARLVGWSPWWVKRGISLIAYMVPLINDLFSLSEYPKEGNICCSSQAVIDFSKYADKHVEIAYQCDIGKATFSCVIKHWASLHEHDGDNQGPSPTRSESHTIRIPRDQSPTRSDCALSSSRSAWAI